MDKLKQFLKYLTWLPAVLLMAFIFGFSSDNSEESSGLSLKVSQEAVEVWNTITNSHMTELQKQDTIEKIHPIIRKLAHFSEYALLGMLIFFPLFTFGVRRKKLILFAEAICFFYACTDEIHQLFVPGRAGRVFDVAIDSLGAICGILFCLVITEIWKKHKCLAN